eukprot:scaffold25307_cov47-Tisochrysis_lutea.AAC.3
MAPGPPSWQTPLKTNGHSSSHIMGGGGGFRLGGGGGGGLCDLHAQHARSGYENSGPTVHSFPGRTRPSAQ